MNPHTTPSPTEPMILAAIAHGHIRPRLTRAYLQRCADWDDWAKSEFKQLDDYRKQKMFGEPQPLPPGANLLPLIWTYVIKPDGTKKARCVCNGNPNCKGSVTLDHTYAAALDQAPMKMNATIFKGLWVFRTDRQLVKFYLQQ